MAADYSKKNLIKLVAALTALALFAYLARSQSGRLQEAMAWIAESGWTGRIAFEALYILACVLFIPGSILTLGAGAVFGLWEGFVLVSLGSTIGATISFWLGRTVARNMVAEKVAGSKKFSAIDDAVGKQGWKIVFLLRLSPVFPFNLLNYGLGLTKVRLRDYFLASWIGMMPGTLLYVYLGSLAGNLAGLNEARERGTTEWIFYGVGLAATLAVTIYITKIAREALSKAIAE